MEAFFVLFTLGRSASELILIFLEEMDPPSPFGFSFFDLVFFWCTYHSYMCLCAGHWQEFFVRGHVCVLLFYAEYHALLKLSIP